MKPPSPQTSSKSSTDTSIIKAAGKTATELDKEFKTYEKILWKVLVYCLNDAPKKKPSGKKLMKKKDIRKAKEHNKPTQKSCMNSGWIMEEEEVQSDEEFEEEEPVNQQNKAESSAKEDKGSMGTNENYEDDSLIDYAHVSIL